MYTYVSSFCSFLFLSFYSFLIPKTTGLCFHSPGRGFLSNVLNLVIFFFPRQNINSPVYELLFGIITRILQFNSRKYHKEANKTNRVFGKVRKVHDMQCWLNILLVVMIAKCQISNKLVTMIRQTIQSRVLRKGGVRVFFDFTYSLYK